MQIRQIYEIQHNIGILGASSPREYIDARGKDTNRPPIKTKKRQTFLASIQKLSKSIPGPGKYQPNPQDKKYAKIVYKKIDFNAESKKPRKNYIEQVIKDKKGIPGVGKYQLKADNSQKIREWHSILDNKARKKAPIFKSTIFDDVHVDCINVDPGSYRTQVPFGKVDKFHTNEIVQGEQKQKEKKRSSSLPKLPGAQTYRPIPSQFGTFQKLLSQKGEVQKSDFSKEKRFREQKQAGPGPKYSLIAEWSPRNNSIAKKKSSNIFKSTSSLARPSIYY